MLWLVVCGVVCLAVGIGIGYVVAARSDRPNASTREVQQELERVRDEYAEHRRTTVEQFTQVAVRFQQVDTAYGNLHRQLADSATRLCGREVATMLGEGVRNGSSGASQWKLPHTETAEHETVPYPEALGEQPEAASGVDETPDEEWTPPRASRHRRAE